jgi:magnesium transporter
MARRVLGLRHNALVPAAAAIADPAEATRIYLYDADGADELIEPSVVHLRGLNPRQLLWIDVCGSAGFASVAERLGIDSETVSRIQQPVRRPDAVFHGEYIHLGVIAADRSQTGYVGAALECVAGESWIVTVRERPLDFLERFGERIRGDSQLGRLNGPGLVAAFLHEHVAAYVRELEPFEAELDRLDLAVLAGRVDDATVFRRLVDLRRRLAHLRTLFASHRELYSLLARPDLEILTASDDLLGFESVSQRADQAFQVLEQTRETIVSSFEIYTTWTAHETNKVMKLLTVVSVTILPPTLLASVMGMNSLPSVLGSPVAFGVTLGAMLALLAGVLGLARRRRWV